MGKRVARIVVVTRKTPLELLIERYGTLGQAMAQLGRAIGMEVIVAERKHATSIRPERRSFADVLQLSDVLSLHCPLTEETRDLIGAEELGQMKRDAL